MPCFPTQVGTYSRFKLHKRKRFYNIIVPANSKALYFVCIFNASCQKKDGTGYVAVSYTHLDVYKRQVFVLLRAVMVAAPAGLLIWLLSHIFVNDQSLLQLLAWLLNPLATPFGMDGVILLAFLLGWPANEIVIPLMLMMYLSNTSMVEMDNYTALYSILTAHGWTWSTAAAFLLFSLFHWPCSTTCLTIKKETGSMAWTILAVVLPTFTAVSYTHLSK